MDSAFLSSTWLMVIGQELNVTFLSQMQSESLDLAPPYKVPKAGNLPNPCEHGFTEQTELFTVNDNGCECGPSPDLYKSTHYS